MQDTGAFLKIELANIERDHGHVSNIRGYGSYIGFDVTQPMANSMYAWLLKSGVQVARSSETEFGVRPALVTKPKHAAPLRNSLKSFHPNHDVNDHHF